MRALLACLTFALPVAAAEPPKPADTFAMKNLVAWCIVPFDSQKRTPKQRVEMLQRLGFTQYAYDWRAEHLPSFPEEIELLKKAKISLKGVWFPWNMGKDGEFILEALKKADVKTELWVMLPQPKAEAQDEKVKESAAKVKGLAQRAAKQGCKVGIYNHGGWTGEPENMVAVAKACGEPNVGIVYNMHHGHSHLPKLDEYLKLMQPHLYCVNLNGMDPEGEKKGQKISIIGEYKEDSEWFKKIRHWSGTYGILGHTNDDAEDRLQDNLFSLNDLVHGSDHRLWDGGGSWRPDMELSDGVLKVLNSTSHRTKRQSKLLIPKAENALSYLRVFVDERTQTSEQMWKKSTPIQGQVEVEVSDLVFKPRFAFEPGLAYRAIFYSGGLHADGSELEEDHFVLVHKIFTIPKATQDKPTTVEAVYPTSSKLPENALRMYLHFSAPMKQGLGQKYIHLTCDGKTVEDPFVQIEQELWNADGKRLTILFDPARVKRGLKPREEAGPILVEGKKHTLTIDAAWPDALGFPLKEKFIYSFDVGPPDDQPIDPAKWTITPPVNGMMEVKFEKPLDKALSERLIWVVDAAGKRLELPVQANKDQTGVKLASVVWKPGKYKLVIDTRLEDVCGNRVGEAFEVDEFKPVTSVVTGKTVEREFEVK